MIGVLGDSSDRDIICEFFELFKTPWEFYREGGHYDVVLCSGKVRFTGSAKLIVCYSARPTQFEAGTESADSRIRGGPRFVSYTSGRIPIYGGMIVFEPSGTCLLTDENSGECVGFIETLRECALARIGYDLFTEVRILLNEGQPAANASIPALELHIALLREVLVLGGVPFIEIPSAPRGYSFIACLTHDVDHPSIRQHKWDHTVFGFFWRAIFGSVHRVCRGRLSHSGLLANWRAAIKLPFVYAGLASDFWRDFDDRYLAAEGNLPSTFFLIPFKGRPGKAITGSAHHFRAARYEAKELAGTARKLMTAGREIGLHGIDAWADSTKGRAEVAEIRQLTGTSAVGARMHWLYYDKDSPKTLEEAGVEYDSTIGYNDTVGYRAGTTQIYKPLNVSQLLELPMHAMDTALFYAAHLGVSGKDARALLGRLVDNAVRFGGCLTINWHDRSLAPERLWDACYHDLVRDMKKRGAWFATAGQAIAWFRKRRSAEFESDFIEPGTAIAKISVNQNDNLPGLRLRIHKARQFSGINLSGSADYTDMAVEESVEDGVPSQAWG